MSDKPKKDLDLARKIWLAGIGAYGKAIGGGIEVAKGAYDKIGEKNASMFNDLVGKGTDLEDKVSDTVKDISPNFEKTKHSFDDRMDRMKSMLGMGEITEQNTDQMERIEDRLDAIEAKLDKLLATAETKPAPRKRKATKKTVKKTVKKTPSKSS